MKSPLRRCLSLIPSQFVQFYSLQVRYRCRSKKVLSTFSSCSLVQYWLHWLHSEGFWAHEKSTRLSCRAACSQPEPTTPKLSWKCLLSESWRCFVRCACTRVFSGRRTCGFRLCSLTCFLRFKISFTLRSIRKFYP